MPQEESTSIGHDDFRERLQLRLRPCSKHNPCGGCDDGSNVHDASPPCAFDDVLRDAKGGLFF